jgi:hypothetical protein
VSATILNIEGRDFDGETTVLTARLADHFSNPVPDGTTVNFIAEGGSVVSFCSTVDGACSATMTSQEFRPANGRVTVLAYAIGEESFTDLDGDGLADKVNSLSGTTELLDADGISTDMPEAFVDYNENGARDGNEPFIDFDSSGTYNAADGDYNGVLCNVAAGSSAGTCAASKAIHVRRNLVIVFSGSNPVFQFNPGSINLRPPAFAACVDGTQFTAPSQDVQITITDVNGNIMPAGTTVAFSTTNGTIVSSPTSFVVPNRIACLAGSGPAGFTCPASSAVALGNAPLTYTVSVKSDVTQGAGPTFICNPNTTASGSLTVTVTTPNAISTSASINVLD